MKAKKILFKWSGIVEFVTCGIFAFFGLVLVLARSILHTVVDAAYNEMQELIVDAGGRDAFVASGDPLSMFVDYSADEFKEYLFKFITIFAIVFLVIAVIHLIFGLLFIKYGRKYEYLLKNRRGKKITLGILTVLFCSINISTILVLIALIIRDNKKIITTNLQGEINES